MSLLAAAPRDLSTLRLLARQPGDLHFMAGGTDLLAVSKPLPQAGTMVDISGIAELQGIAIADDGLHIGAATTIAAITASPLIRRHTAALGEAAAQCGSVQIRNRATIGGNVANAAPAADLPPVLKCAGAQFIILRRSGAVRRVSFDELMPRAGGTTLQTGDLITEVVLPAAELLPCSGFVKVGRRQEMTISRLNLAMQLEYDRQTRRFGVVRLVAGAIAPAPQFLTSAAAALAGKSLSVGIVRSFLDALVHEIDQAIPDRASRPYKRRAIMGLGLDLLAQVTGCDAAELSVEGVMS